MLGNNTPRQLLSSTSYLVFTHLLSMEKVIHLIEIQLLEELTVIYLKFLLLIWKVTDHMHCCILSPQKGNHWLD